MKTVKTAVIVAAGASRRLYPLTKNLPKCLLEVGKETLLKRAVRILKSQGIRDIIIVTGFLEKKIKGHLKGGYRWATNPEYLMTNNMASLLCAKPCVTRRTFVYMHADILFEEQILSRLLDAFGRGQDRMSLAVDFGPVDREAMKVSCAKDGRLIKSSKDIPLKEADGEWTGIAVVSGAASPKLFQAIETLMAREHLMAYDTLAFTRLASKMRISCVPTGNIPWIEIDTPEDLKKARKYVKDMA